MTPGTSVEQPFPLPTAAPATIGLDPARLDLLCITIAAHVANGFFPGAQVAVARHGHLALARSFGNARLNPAAPATDDTLFPLYSLTKMITAAAIWTLVEDGPLRYDDPVARVLPGFEKHGKSDITVFHLLTHQAGFPRANIRPDIIEDHARIRAAICEFVPEYPPGSRIHYHPAAAAWVAAMLIEACTGTDFRTYICSRFTLPLGLAADLVLGVPDTLQPGCADMHDPTRAMAPIPADRAPPVRRAGHPGAGGYGTARGMAAFFQALLQGGQLNGTRILAPRTIAHAIRNHTGDRIDANHGYAANRGLGPHIRGDVPVSRGIGTLAHPTTFGHGGAGSSYAWADPDSGTSFAFLCNARQSDPDRDSRLESLSNITHAAIVG